MTRTPTEQSALCAEDRQYLFELEKKFQLVRDRTAAVALGYATGFALSGRGGIGKTHVVTAELERLRTPYVQHNSHMTGFCLFGALEQCPEKVHLLEDVEDITRDKAALGVLRSALWATQSGIPGKTQRIVTWNARPRRSCLFTGGIIITMNRALGDIPELAALRTRIAYTRLTVTAGEAAALVRKLARSGIASDGGPMDEPTRLEVAEFLIDECRRSGRQIDIRLYINALMDRLQNDDCNSGLTWRDLVRARVEEGTPLQESVENPGLRALQKRKELELTRQIAELPRAERDRIWIEQTKKSVCSLYRRLNELGQNDGLDAGY